MRPSDRHWRKRPDLVRCAEGLVDGLYCNSRNRSPMFGPFATPVAERPLAARAGCPWPAFSLAGDSPLEGAGRLPTGKARSIATARPDACANARSPGPRPRAFLRPTGARCSRPTPRPSPAHSGLPDRRSPLREGRRGQGVLWEPHPEQLPDRSCRRPGCRVERGRPSFRSRASFSSAAIRRSCASFFAASVASMVLVSTFACHLPNGEAAN